MWWDIFRDLGLRAHYVVTVRAPAEAAISMARKNPRERPMTQLRGELMWLVYNYDIFRYLRGMDPTVVDYADWFVDAPFVSRRLSQRLGLYSNMTATEQAACVTSIVRADLRHHLQGADSLASSLSVSSPFFQSIAEARGTANESSHQAADRYIDFLHAVFPFLELLVEDAVEAPVSGHPAPTEWITEREYLHRRLREEKEKLRSFKALTAEMKLQLQQAEGRISKLAAESEQYHQGRGDGADHSHPGLEATMMRSASPNDTPSTVNPAPADSPAVPSASQPEQSMHDPAVSRKAGAGRSE
jgi:hypothetical protein